MVSSELELTVTSLLVNTHIKVFFVIGHTTREKAWERITCKPLSSRFTNFNPWTTSFYLSESSQVFDHFYLPMPWKEVEKHGKLHYIFCSCPSIHIKKSNCNYIGYRNSHTYKTKYFILEAFDVDYNSNPV